MERVYTVLLIIIVIISCTTEDFEVPQGISREIPTGTIIPLANLRRPVANQFPQAIVTFDMADQLVEGYVISNDASGNFFKELFIQDKPENPTIGLQVLIDERALHQRFPFGSKIRIRLKGLSITEQNGVVKLGTLVNNEIKAIPFTAIDNIIFRTNEIAEITPLDISIATITEDIESVYVRFSNMQFDKNVLEPTLKTFAGESEDSFDGLRPLKECSTNSFLALCTSTFSSFNQLSLPSGNGIITGVLTKDFRGFDYVLKLNEAKDIDFRGIDRCDTTFFGCDTPNSVLFPQTDKNILFKETFDALRNEAELDDQDWFNVNITGDEIRWDNKKVPNVDNRIMSLTSNNTGLNPLEAWLVTPVITINGAEELFFSCRLRTDNNNGKALNVLITNSWNSETNNPIDATWEVLDFEIPVENQNYVTFLQRISCVEGSIRIAFQYKGFDPVVTSIYEIDEVQFFKLD